MRGLDGRLLHFPLFIVLEECEAEVVGALTGRLQSKACAGHAAPRPVEPRSRARTQSRMLMKQR